MDLSRLYIIDVKQGISRGVAQAHTIDDLRIQAKRKLPKVVYDFVVGGAGDEVTVRRNQAAFSEIGLEPRYLRDVGVRDLSTTVLGMELSSPIILGPTGLQRLAHRDGELAVARAASKAGSVYVAAISSSVPIEEIAAASDGGPMWFQIYLWKSRAIMESIISRARAVGCRTLVLTIDVPVMGNRERDLRNGMTMPPRLGLRNALDAARRPRWVIGITQGEDITYLNLRDELEDLGDSMSFMQYMDSHLMDPSSTWDELEWLRTVWDGPLVVKGITDVESARRAVDLGANGVIVSNHGGRQLDGAPATIARLPAVVDAVGDHADVLVDGGIRRGTDVVKALSLGAKACLVGRPYWYGLAAGGEDGVRRTIDILNGELDRTLALVGRPAVRDLDRSVIRLPERAVL